MSFLYGLVRQGEVVHAVLLLETRTRFGAYSLGYLWALIEPTLFISTLKFADHAIFVSTNFFWTPYFDILAKTLARCLLILACPSWIVGSLEEVGNHIWPHN